MFAQEFRSRRRIFDSFPKVEILIKLKCFLQLSFRFVSQLDARLLPPKEIGTNRHDSMRGIPITHLPHVSVDAKDFLQDDYSRTITARRQRKVTIELFVIE